MLSILTGLAAGAAHVVGGPDHWTAIAPFTIAHPKRALGIGVRWGLGHGLGILLLGAVGILAGEALSTDLISTVAEGMVGVVLVVSGVWALYRSRSIVIHSHPHDHDDEHHHEHVHLHVGQEAHESPEAHRTHTHAAFGMGVLHGIAGAGPLWALLPTMVLPTDSAIAYLAGFLVSSIVAMGGFAYLLGRYASASFAPRLDRIFAFVGWGSIVLGLFWTGMATFSS